MLLALTRAVSPTLIDCQLTHLARQPLDVGRAVAEHEAYERRLTQLGATVRRLPPTPDLPDAVFVEDTAVVLDDVAIITHPGAASRRPETATVADALGRLRPLIHIRPPATIDGGDVLVAGRTVFVGLSSRTNQAAVDQLQLALGPSGYRVTALRFAGCLHLKSAVTLVADNRMLLNPGWVDPGAFPGYRTISVDPAEPEAANALWIGGSLIHPLHHPRTRARLEAEGLHVSPVAMEQLAKAEAGVTCCSLLVLCDAAT